MVINMINIKELEDKIINLIGDLPTINIKALNGKLTAFELMNLICLSDEFYNIEIINLDLESPFYFEDEKYKIKCPIFEIGKV